MFERLKGQPFTACCRNPFSSKPTPFDLKGILSVRWCSISDPSKSPSALECETRPPSPWGSSRDASAHSSPAYAGERLRHSRWFPGAYAMLPSGTHSRPNTVMDGFGQQAVDGLLPRSISHVTIKNTLRLRREPLPEGRHRVRVGGPSMSYLHVYPAEG